MFCSATHSNRIINLEAYRWSNRDEAFAKVAIEIRMETVPVRELIAVFPDREEKIIGKESLFSMQT